MDSQHADPELHVEQLYRHTDPATLDLDAIRAEPGLDGIVGQERAEVAIRLAISAPDSRYNLFVIGTPGTGRTKTVKRIVEEVAKARPAPKDWCYVHNFDRPERPVALELPAGSARAFANDVKTYVDTCGRVLRQMFHSEEFFQECAGLRHEAIASAVHYTAEARASLRALGYELGCSPDGERETLMPLKQERSETGAAQPIGDDASATDGPIGVPQATSEEDLVRAAEAQQTAEHVCGRLQFHREALQHFMHDGTRAIQARLARTALTGATKVLGAKYATNGPVFNYLRALSDDIIANAALFAGDTREVVVSNAGAYLGEDSAGSLPDGVGDVNSLRMLLRRYAVNVFVTHAHGASAPIVTELNPSRRRLSGTTGDGSLFDKHFSDHLSIRPGAMHRANGGYLILHAVNLPSVRYSWETLKEMLTSGQLHVAGDEAALTLGGLELRPEPIDASLRVILIGTFHDYEPLKNTDADFDELFKVRAEFSDRAPRTHEAERAYARFAIHTVETHELPPISGAGVARVIEQASRWVADQEHVSTNLAHFRDLVLEAGLAAQHAHAVHIGPEHVRKALDTRRVISGLAAERYHRDLRRGIEEVDVAGHVVGRVNGLSVLVSNHARFGAPNRLSVRVAPGTHGVISIEIETGGSDRSHAKGVLTLENYLRSRYAQGFPLCLTATVSFEQFHGEVEGDSASGAQLYALLSALSNVALRQDLAVTGAVSLHGKVQAIGSVNEKIEGFFEVCNDGGLTGTQGVIIPKSNVTHLMLREDVVEAVRQGRFHIYAVSTVDEAMELLTGKPVGVPEADGQYPEGSLNRKVAERLWNYYERVRSLTVETVPMAAVPVRR